MRSLAWAVVCLLGLFSAPASSQVQGIIIVPFKTDSATYGEVGQLVQFSEEDYRVTLELSSGRVVVRSSEGDVVPLDALFTPSYVLSTLRNCQPFCRARNAVRREEEDEVAQRVLLLVERTIELFPDYPDIAEFRALRCDFLRPVETKAADLAPAIACAEQFVRDYPDHPRADELEYSALSLRIDVYEFEGDVSAMKQQADALEAFLIEHPANRLADQISARVARLYYMMQESSPPGAARNQYRARALELYDRLVDASDIGVRLSAIVLRFNLQQGRAIYMNPDAWTRAF